MSGAHPGSGAVVTPILEELDQLSGHTPAAALPVLLSAPVQAAVLAQRDIDEEHAQAACSLYRTAIDRHLSPIVMGLATGRPISDADRSALATATRSDPIASAFTGTGQPMGPGADPGPGPGAEPGPDVARDRPDSAPDPIVERIRLLRRVWPSFEAWWRGYFPDGDLTGAASDLWRLYLPYAQWIVERKRRRRPDGLYMVGFNGSPGSGKTVLTSALAVVLNELLDRAEGRAVARSGDDWYLSKADREPLRALGYDPGVPGVSNRAAPGTHDLAWLIRNLDEMRRSDADSVIRMGNFDKKADDQPTGADRYVEVRGRVGVFLFDLWFAGARTDADPMAVPDGLWRRVAEQLPLWRPVFDRMDALWCFDWPSFDQMVRERMAQERLIVARRGGQGMSEAHIRAFMAYMIERTWDWRTTSPVPPEQAVTFHAVRDSSHRVVAVYRGGRAS